MVHDVIVSTVAEGSVVQEPFLDGGAGVWVVQEVELLWIAIGVFDQDAVDGVETPVAVPAACEIDRADKFMDDATEFDAGFNFKIDAEVIIREHNDLRINNYDAYF